VTLGLSLAFESLGIELLNVAAWALRVKSLLWPCLMRQILLPPTYAFSALTLLVGRQEGHPPSGL